MEKDIKEPIFICGCQRSGTTLVSQLLSQHSKMDILWETHFFPFFWNPFILNKNVTSSAVQEYKSAFLTQKSKLNDLCQDLIHEGFSARDYHVLLTDILLKFKGKRSIRVGEKTPSHIFYIPHILRNFKNSKIVIIYRDPRAIALSEKKKLAKNNIQTYSHFKIGLRWSLSVQLANKYLKKYGASSVHLICYEKLLDEPEIQLQKLCNFLGEDYEPSMLNIKVVNSSFTVNPNDSFSKSSVSRWKEDLQMSEISYLDLLLGKQIKKRGYHLHSPGNRNIVQKIKKLPEHILFRILMMIGYINPALFHFFTKDKRYRIYKFRYP